MHFKSDNNRHMVDVLFVLTLFGVFAISALTLVILGANIYKSTVDHMNNNFSTRTSCAYITQKIRQQDEAHALSIGQLGDSESLILTEEINDTVYNTYIYEYNGYLCELLARADQELSPSAGNQVMEINQFSISEITNSLYLLTIETPEEDTVSFHISSRCNNGDF